MVITRKIFSYWLFLKEKFRLSAQRNQNEPQSIKSVCYKYCLVSVLTCFRVNIKNGSGNISIYRGTVPHHGEPTSANIKLSLNVATWRNIKKIWCRPTTRFVFIARLVIVSNIYLDWLLQLEKFRPISSVNQNWLKSNRSNSVWTYEYNVASVFLKHV